MLEVSGDVQEQDARVATAGIHWSSSSVLAGSETGGGAAVCASGARWEADAASKDGGPVWGTRRRRFKRFGGRAKPETALLHSVASGVKSCGKLVAVC